MYVIILLCILIGSIVFFLGLKPSISIFLVGLAFGIAVITSMAVLFGPKTFLLLTGMDLDRNLNLVKVSDRKGGAVVSGEKKTQGNGYVPDEDLPILDLPVGEILKKGNKESNMKLCREQILKWQSLLLRIENSELNTNSGGGSSSLNSSSNRPSVLQSRMSLKSIIEDVPVPPDEILVDAEDNHHHDA